MSTQPEARLSARVVRMVRSRGHFAVKLHGGAYQQAGLPDVTGALSPSGRSLWIETKLPGGRLTRLQEHTLGDLAAHGALVGVVRSLDDARGLIEQWEKEER